MLRISAFIAVLALIGMTPSVSSTEPQKPADTKGCYSYEQFMAACNKKGNRLCEKWWDWKQRAGGGCVR
jgi:hypothetical protein